MRMGTAKGYKEVSQPNHAMQLTAGRFDAPRIVT
jgi:hypothetical protein